MSLTVYLEWEFAEGYDTPCIAGRWPMQHRVGKMPKLAASRRAHARIEGGVRRLERQPYLDVSELGELREAEKELLGDAAENIQSLLEDSRNFSLASGLDLDLVERGIITTLAITTARFAASRNKSQDSEALSFAIMRCMAFALFHVLAFSAEGPPEKCNNPTGDEANDSSRFRSQPSVSMRP